MIPYLYEKTETEFNSNGLGRLVELTDCVVTEQRNGEFTLEAHYPTSGRLYKELTEDRFIYCRTSDSGSLQPFRIYAVTRKQEGLALIRAYHVSYELAKIITMPFTAETCAEALQGLKDNAVGYCPFDFWTDIDSHPEDPFTMKNPVAIRALLGGSIGSILDIFGQGEYEFDGRHVKLTRNRGRDNGVVLRRGKNITEMSRKTSVEEIYTAIVPYAMNGEELITLPEKTVDSAYIADYPYTAMKAVDFSTENGNVTEEKLRGRARTYVDKNTGWESQQNIKVQFTALWETEEYKDVAPLQTVKLCDVVTVIDDVLGISKKIECVETKYNVLLDRYDEITLGTPTTTLAQAVIEATGVEDVPSKAYVFNMIGSATDMITGNNGGYVRYMFNDDDQPVEILITDSLEVDDATNLWRWNLSGLGHSSHGYNGPYDTAITMDGHIVADFMDVGTLRGITIQACNIEGLDNTININGVCEINEDSANFGDKTGNSATYLRAYGGWGASGGFSNINSEGIKIADANGEPLAGVGLGTWVGYGSSSQWALNCDVAKIGNFTVRPDGIYWGNTKIAGN